MRLVLFLISLVSLAGLTAVFFEPIRGGDLSGIVLIGANLIVSCILGVYAVDR